MSEFTVTIQRGGNSEQATATSTTTAGDLVGDGKAIVVARINGELCDLATELRDGDVIEPVEISSPDGLNVLRHSTAHLMAQAIQDLYPQTRLGIGPPIRDGFYYDFDVERPFTPEDLEQIEKRMGEILKQGQRFVRREIGRAHV